MYVFIRKKSFAHHKIQIALNFATAVTTAIVLDPPKKPYKKLTWKTARVVCPISLDAAAKLRVRHDEDAFLRAWRPAEHPADQRWRPRPAYPASLDISDPVVDTAYPHTRELAWQHHGAVPLSRFPQMEWCFSDWVSHHSPVQSSLQQKPSS